MRIVVYKRNLMLKKVFAFFFVYFLISNVVLLYEIGVTEKNTVSDPCYTIKKES